MIDLVLLRSFVTVVDTGNFTRAAEHLHLTQSTVSQQILRLEQQLDCRLLDRSQRQVLPTEEGDRLLGYARRLLRLANEASEALSPEHTGGVLRLGVPEDLGSGALMPLIASFARERPRLRLEVESTRKFAKAEGAAAYPTVSVQATAGELPYHDESTNNEYAAAGVVINWPIFSGGLYTARRKEAALKAQAAVVPSATSRSMLPLPAFSAPQPAR